MAQLNTRIVLRNDSTANWEVNSTSVLLKGEVGLEFKVDGKVGVKIGDGVKTWAELDYFGGDMQVSGDSLVGDDVTIVVDGQTIKLKGFEEAEVGAHLVKAEDGTLVWEKFGEAVVDEIKDLIGSKEDGTGLAGDIAAIEDKIGEPFDYGTGDPATGLYEIIDNVSKSVSSLDTQIGNVPVETTVVEMIEDAKYDDTALSGRVTTIEDDYLTSADKTELEGSIATAKQEAIDTILGEAVDADFDTLKEVADWIQSDTTNSAELVGRVTTIETTLLDKVDKVEGHRLITPTEADKLAALVIGDGGDIEISGKVNAENVEGLAELLAGKVDVVEGKGLSTNDLTDELVAKINGASQNAIESITLNGTALEVANKTVNIPVAGTDLGVVKASSEIGVAADGSLEVGSISLNKIFQEADDTLILNGGGSAV